MSIDVSNDPRSVSMTSLPTTAPTRHGPPLWPVVLCVGLAALVCVGRRLPAVLAGVDLFSDDAYYYLVIARNLVNTGEFTFDGLTPTNGFHPLLLWIEAAVYAVCGTGAEALRQYQVAWLTMAAAFFATVLLSLNAAVVGLGAKAGQHSNGSEPTPADESIVAMAVFVLLGVMVVPRFSMPLLGGMEAILVFPLLLLFGGLLWRRRYGWAGLVAVALVLSRLDMMPYLVAPAALACAWRERRRGSDALRLALLVLLPAVLGVVAFLVYNFWHFGHPMPIHGTLKSCFPRIHFQPHQLLRVDHDAVLLQVAVVSAVVGVLLLATRREHRDARWLGLSAAGLTLIQIMAFLCFQKWSKPVPSWYLGPSVMTGVFALAVGLGATLPARTMRWVTIVVAAVALLVNVGGLLRQWHAGTPPWSVAEADANSSVVSKKHPQDVVAFMRSTPPDAVWACTDCGKLAFWSGRRVVNLDGLVNDFQYQEALRDKRLADYLRQRGVRYLVFLCWDRPQWGDDANEFEPMYHSRVAPDVFAGDYREAQFYVVSYRYLTYSESVVLPRAAEVWRSEPVRDGRARGRAVVFKLGK